MTFSLSHKQLKQAERSVYSQGGQDGVLEAIFNQIGHGTKTFVEFGARDGVELSNTANLRLNYGWSGILIDAEPKSDIVHKAFITTKNINKLLSDIESIMYLSIDMDGNDYWVWMAIVRDPNVVTIEYNSKFNNYESVSIAYNPDHIWEGDDYYGASLLALKRLGEAKGYTLVYVVDRFDAVFVRNDLIDDDYEPPSLNELSPEPIIAHEKISNKRWVFV